jgi:hypothetical protein
VKSKIIISLLLALLSISIIVNILIIPTFVNSSSHKDAGIRGAYYSGIQDYCEHVTIIDVSTGKEINRTKEYCENLVKDFQNKRFYEKYHPSY